MSEVTSRVTAEGTVTIPEDLLVLLGLEPGNQVAFDRLEDGRVVLRKVEETTLSSIESLRGHACPGLSTDELLRLTRGRAPGDPL